ncbi:MAG: glycosyltransferase family 1 protein [Clostridia bacterium]|nr:glycosyltransferase family 1 protein [Clostridia bacterium]
MRNVLFINGGPLDYGGISSYMMNYCQYMDPNRIHVDFVVHGMEEGPREAEAIAMGARVYHVPRKREDYKGNVSGLKELFASGNYPIVHSHLDGMNGFVLSLAKDAGVPWRISHCHNTGYLTTNPLRKMLHWSTKRKIPSVATHLFACSRQAARFFYGERLGSGEGVQVIQNAISLERYAFDPEIRKALRQQLALSEDAFVLGHVGRFEHQKNHVFLLNAFAKAKKNRQDLHLVLLGDGILRSEIEAQIHTLGIGDSVHLLGYQPDAAAYYSCFDAFVLPSRFEGLGIVLIEAQTAGLPCLASDQVPPDAGVTNCTYLPLDEGIWAEGMAGLSRQAKRDYDPAPFIRAGFEISAEAVKLQRFYEELPL